MAMKAKGISESEGTVTVTRTLNKKTDSQESHIEIRPFITAPARIAVEKSFTRNMGNFNSLRIAIRIEVPCYVEEVKTIYNKVNDMVQERLDLEAKDLDDISED